MPTILIEIPTKDKAIPEIRRHLSFLSFQLHTIVINVTTKANNADIETINNLVVML